ncbi:MAG: restriction endonuclease [Gammaproteobacteria bacterium AqS3]|nr:restriction endonuclease [Gammaproteobacteria bacterium AqS3]
MKRGSLKQYFTDVAVKRLSTVEVDLKRSHQHELNGVSALKAIFGETKERLTFQATFLWLDDELEKAEEEDKGFLTWYDARQNDKTRSSEYRLYFSSTNMMNQAREGDSIFIALKPDRSLFVIAVPSQSTIKQQLLWLFDLKDLSGSSFEVKEVSPDKGPESDFAVNYILDILGIKKTEPSDPERLDHLLKQFGGEFPRTRRFSDLARDNCEDVDPLEAPDLALTQWLEFEETLFLHLEKKIIEKRLQDGFVGSDGDIDVDSFLKFSLSVQNRRKARAGLALENHLEYIFINHKLEFDRGATTENRSKPDFLFPGSSWYHCEKFPASHLTMLGAKSTCKDRWRQVLSEARHIPKKHLLTLEPSISEYQTTEMKNSNLQLVLPRTLHQTYTRQQRSWLIDLEAFISEVRRKQTQAGL